MVQQVKLDPDRKRPVRLADGTVLEVGDREYYAISVMFQMMDDVARGGLRNISLVAIDAAGREAYRSLVTFDVVGLDELANSLSMQSKLAAKMSAHEQGTIRVNTSFTEH